MKTLYKVQTCNGNPEVIKLENGIAKEIVQIDVIQSEHLPITTEYNGEKYQLNYPLKSLYKEAASILNEGKKIFIMHVPNNSGSVKYWIYKTMQTKFQTHKKTS